jgi:biopolymer transport protein ExbD
MTDPTGTDSQSSEHDFGLVAPTGSMAREWTGDRPAPEMSVPQNIPRVPSESSEFKKGGWKGFEADEIDPDPDVSFGDLEKDPDRDELDMTPMCDVVFLLLIFFMVTASFTLQKSIEQPPSKIEDPSANVIEDPETEDEYVEVIIDQTNTYFVTTRDSEEVEAPSDREMRARMRDAKRDTGADRLIIRAHVDSLHRKVVTVWDAGNALGMNRIEMRTTDEDF